jgi:hypothetical protein
MTTKRLLDVNILKKDKQKLETRKRNREGSDDDVMTAPLHDGSGAVTDQTNNRRESTASARLSYSSTSSSSSSQSSWTDLREDDVPLLEALVCVVGSEVSACEEANTTLAGEKSSLSDIQTDGLNHNNGSLPRNHEVDWIESTILMHDDEDEGTDILQHSKASKILIRNERRSHYDEKEESPLDTSFESELTPANTKISSGSNSSSIRSIATRSSSRSNT